VSLHYVAKYKCKKSYQSNTASMLVNETHFQQEMQWMICTMLKFVRSVSLDICRIERYVCFWPLWFSKPTISSTVVTFSSVCASFSLLVLRKLFLLVQVPYQSLVSTAKWHITSLVYCQCMKNYYLRQYHLVLFTNIRNVCNTKHNLFFVRKLVKIVSENEFLHMYYSDFSNFWKFMFYMVV